MLSDMACLGCGAVTETKLCCPTCGELGQTSFFCTQECFTKSWAEHSKVHELLRRKRASTLAGGGISSSAPAKPQPPPPKQDTYSAYPKSRAAPLPGGMPLVGNFAAQKRNPGATSVGAAKKSDDAENSGLAVLGSLVGHAKAMFGSQGATATNSARAGHQNGSRLRERSNSRDATKAAVAANTKQGGASPDRGAKPSVSLQNALWVLVLITVFAGGGLYMQQRRMAEEFTGDGQAALSAAAQLVVRSAKGGNEEAAVVVASDQTAPAAAADSASVSEKGSPASVDSLRAEIAGLRDMVEKHDKMLRYVMERYQEKEFKASQEAAPPGVKAAEVEFSQPSLRGGAGEVTSEGRSGDAVRKRKAGGDSSMVGMPQSETPGISQ